MENRGRQNCDGLRAQDADRLLIRPASGRRADTGLSDRTYHWKDTHTRGHSGIESRTKSTDANLTNAPDGLPHTHSAGMFPGAVLSCLAPGRSGEARRRCCRRDARRSRCMSGARLPFGIRCVRQRAAIDGSRVPSIARGARRARSRNAQRETSLTARLASPLPRASGSSQ